MVHDNGHIKVVDVIWLTIEFDGMNTTQVT